VNRERLASVALRALPAELRASRGEEIVGTLLDSSVAGPGRFGQEVVGLVRFGLRARAARTASAGTRRLVADGFCCGAILVMTLDLSTLLAQRVGRGYADSLVSWTSIGVLGVILATALVGAERLAGVAALAWTASRMPDLVAHNPTFDGVAPTSVPVVCFAVLILAPRRRGFDLRRLGWLGATAALVVAFGPRDSGAFGVIVGGAAIVVIVAAVLRLATDARLAIACSLPAAYVGIQVAGKPAVPAWLLVVVPPLVVAAGVVRMQRLQEHARL
jgi:hypothetical protein